MTLHYHGGPINPVARLLEMAGRCFCVSHANADQVVRVHEIGQSVMLDNGAFSAWNAKVVPDWPRYYAWADRWLDYPTTWAVIPDVIDAGGQAQDALIREWPHGERGAPVWHMDEPVDRLLRLCDAWPRVCIGSTAEFKVVLSPAWRRKIDEAFEAVSARHRRMPWLHMLRGMQLATKHWPFASLDSTDVARNHNRAHNSPTRLAQRWDAANCPPRFEAPPFQMEMLG